MRKEEERKIGDCIKVFDFYKDLPREVADPTILGATMSVGVLALVGILFFYQLVEFFSFRS